MPGGVAILLDHDGRNQWWCSRRSRWIYSQHRGIFICALYHAQNCRRCHSMHYRDGVKVNFHWDRCECACWWNIFGAS